MKPGEAPVPPSDLVLIDLGVEESGDRTPLMLLDLCLDRVYSSAIGVSVSEALNLHVFPTTHVANRSIASSTGLLILSSSLPFNPR